MIRDDGNRIRVASQRAFDTSDAQVRSLPFLVPVPLVFVR
jgi:hypothetical protein